MNLADVVLTIASVTARSLLGRRRTILMLLLAVHILTKPIPRWAIVLPKLAVAGGLTALMLVPSTIISGLLVGGTAGRELGLTVAYGIAVLIGSFVYSTIFVALSAATSRGLVIGLGYSLLWEGLLSGALKGTQLFSVR
jgi:ABC-2 type transport system permease protein